jgi:cytochrome c oxidase subunit 1
LPPDHRDRFIEQPECAEPAPARDPAAGGLRKGNTNPWCWKIRSLSSKNSNEMQWKNLLPILVLAGIAGTLPLFLIRAHHLFVSGLNPFLGYVFLLLLFLIILPVLVKAFGFFKTRWLSKTAFPPSLLFAIGYLSYLITGAWSGSLLEVGTFDFHLHDTYFVIAGIHTIIIYSVFLGLLGIFYYSFPKITSRSLNNPMGYIHFWITYACLYLILPAGQFGRLVSPQHPVSEMPRPYIDYSNWTSPDRFGEVNLFVARVIIMLFLAQLFFVGNIFYSLIWGKKVVRDPA